MKGHISNAFLFADRCYDGKPDQVSGMAWEDSFLKGEENIKIGRRVIWEVILFYELHMTWEAPHEVLMSVHNKAEGIGGQSGAFCLFLSVFVFYSCKLKMHSVRKEQKYCEM